MPPETLRQPRIKAYLVNCAKPTGAWSIPDDNENWIFDLNHELLEALGDFVYLPAIDGDQPDATLHFIIVPEGPPKMFAGAWYGNLTESSRGRALYTDPLSTFLFGPLGIDLLEVNLDLHGRILQIHLPVEMIRDRKARLKLWSGIRDGIKGWWYDTPIGWLITNLPLEDQGGKSARQLGSDESHSYRAS